MININQIDLADVSIESMEIDLQDLRIEVVLPYCFDNSTQKQLTKTEIVISNWIDLSAIRYDISEAFGKAEEVDISLCPEAFDLIQESAFVDGKLSLRGFSKDSGSWIVYEIISPEVKI